MAAIAANLERGNLTDEQFYHLCQVNEAWKLERNAKGELLRQLKNETHDSSRVDREPLPNLLLLP
jgi:hypothetical protein